LLPLGISGTVRSQEGNRQSRNRSQGQGGQNEGDRPSAHTSARSRDSNVESGSR
jgi:hypothetical protein